MSVKPALLDSGVKDLVFAYMNKPGIEFASPGGKERLKQALAFAAQNGMTDPRTALLAGMFVDKITTPTTPPSSTVFQDTMQPPAQPPAQSPAQPPAQPPAAGLEAAAVSPVEKGLTALSVPNRGYAGGGMIAFDDGGEVRGPVDFDGVPGFASAGSVDPRFYNAYVTANPYPRKKLVEDMTLAELQEYNRTGAIPPRLQEMLGGRAVAGNQMLGGDFYSSLPRFTQELPEPVPTTTARPISEITDTSGDIRGLPTKDEMRQAAAATRASMSPEGRAAVDAMRAEKNAAIDAELMPQPRAQVAATGAQPPAGGQDVAVPSGQLSIEDFRRQQREFGIKDDPYAEIREKISAFEKSMAGDKTGAVNMAMLKAGAAMMSGTSPHAFVNIGKGIGAGAEDYATALKDIKSQERELFRMNTELVKAEDSRARGDFADYRNRLEKAEELRLRALSTQADIDRAKASMISAQAQAASKDKPSIFKEQWETYSESAKAEGKKPSWSDFRKSLTQADETAALNAMVKADTVLADNIEYGRLSRSEKPEDRKKAEAMRTAKIREYMGALGSSGGNRVIQFNDIPNIR